MSDIEQRPTFEDEGDGPRSSEAEIIEAEAGLETQAAPTGEATWAEDASPGNQSLDQPGDRPGVEPG